MNLNTYSVLYHIVFTMNTLVFRQSPVCMHYSIETFELYCVRNRGF